MGFLGPVPIIPQFLTLSSGIPHVLRRSRCKRWGLPNGRRKIGGQLTKLGRGDSAASLPGTFYYYNPGQKRQTP
jgi:hypothetical protein